MLNKKFLQEFYISWKIIYYFIRIFLPILDCLFLCRLCLVYLMKVFLPEVEMEHWFIYFWFFNQVKPLLKHRHSFFSMEMQEMSAIGIDEIKHIKWNKNRNKYIVLNNKNYNYQVTKYGGTVSVSSLQHSNVRIQRLWFVTRDSKRRRYLYGCESGIGFYIVKTRF